MASKSGGTIETDSHRRVYEQAFRDAGIDPAERIIVVTDPGSPLEAARRARPATAVVLADPNVGGRYSALSAFGLVPSALAGADVAAAARRGRRGAAAAAANEGNPGLAARRRARRAAARRAGQAAAAATALSDITGLPDWIEQLIAESTGKHGKGILPVVAPTPGPAPAGRARGRRSAPEGAGRAVTGPLGAQFLVWEYATAIAGRLIGINPFDQPNVAESKENTSRILAEAGDDGPLPTGSPALVDGAVEVYGEVPDGAKDLADVLDRPAARDPRRRLPRGHGLPRPVAAFDAPPRAPRSTS